MTSAFARLRTLAIVVTAVTHCCAADEPLTRVQIARIGKASTALVEVQAARGQGHASAFCIHPDGWFVTNAHVAQGELTLVLNTSLKTEKTYPARVVRSDSELDLALLHIEGTKDLPALALGSDEGLEEQMDAMAFGFPLAGGQPQGRAGHPSISVNAGSITALRRQDNRLKVIQLDAELNPGNSGGPVLDNHGKVIGVVRSGLVARGLGRTGINQAIPVSEVAKFLARPEVQFTPPRLGPAELHKPLTFEARVTPLLPSPPLKVELILKAGKDPERTLRMEAQGDRYHVTAVPIPGQAEARPLRIVARFDNATLEVTTTERSFKVGRRELTLGDVRNIHHGSPSRVILQGGETITGALVGLETVPARLGGQPLSVDLASAQEVTITPVGQVERVACTLIVRQGEKEIYRQSRALSGMLRRDAKTAGPAGSQLSTPVGVAFGPDGDLYVDSNGNTVLQYNGTTGALEATFVGQGSGGLGNADEMVFGPDGNLYVSCHDTRSVLRYDWSTGAFLGPFVSAGSGGLNDPHGLAFGPDGNLYVADAGAARILKYDGQTGASLGTFASGNGLRENVDLAFGPDGNLYVSNRGNEGILEFNGKTGAFIRIFASSGATGLGLPHGLAFGPDGNLYVAGEFSNVVVRFNGQTGAFIDVFVAAGSGGLTQPVGLTFKDGYLFVGSYRTGQVLRYNGATGAFVDVFTKNAADGG
jgi:DNA-binding beta-propeller fold protein YncE